MYKEHRPTESSREVWTGNFASRPKWQDALSDLKFRTDGRWRAIRERLPPGARVLDAGSGLGQWVDYLRRRGYDALGLDYSETLIGRSRMRYPDGEWVVGSIQAIPLPDQSVDAIISWGVIEHDETGPQAALAEFRRVLRPGGLIFVTVPCDTEAMRASSRAIWPDAGRDDPFFQYFFTEDDLTRELQAAGFVSAAVRVTSRHIAPVLPKAYGRLSERPAIVRDLACQVLKPYTWVRDDSAAMLLGVGERPRVEHPVHGDPEPTASRLGI